MTAALTSPFSTRRAPAPLVFDPHATATAAAVEIVIPVYNEEADLERSVTRLVTYLADRFPVSWVVTIADNASIDQTWSLACGLAHRHEGVRAVHLDEKGRGRALRAVWSASTSPVVAYMDVDLSTDLDALLPLVAPLLSGHSDLAIGSRLARSARVARGPKREAISRTYNLLLRAALRTGFSDAQCGFKAARTDVLHELLPLVEDQGWFFDTELLVLAEHNGLRIHEVPVDWVDDPDSRVHIVSTATDDLRGIGRLLWRFAHGEGVLPTLPAPQPTSLTRPVREQLVRFASIGIVSTVAFGAIFVALADRVGMTAAALMALVSCTLANTAAHRRLTFATGGRHGRTAHHLRALAVAVIPFALLMLTLATAAATGVTSVLGVLVGLTIANGIATMARFVLLPRWVFADRRTTGS